ncbi:MAG: hypothetical protein Q4C18_02010 [Eubacteriales bacterium]|nr:hypothetical protein [Eubacteriales bacterium]
MKKYVSAILALVMLVASTTAVFAGKTEKKAFTGKATHTNSSQWNYKKKRSSVDVSPAQKILTEKRYYKGRSWFTSPYSVTDNYYHKKRQADTPTVTLTTSKTIEISGSTSGTIEGAAASMGYKCSMTTSQSVSQPLGKNEPTGYYHYAAKGKMLDLKGITKKTYYKRTRGKWKKVKSSTSSNTGCETASSQSDTGVYYAWIKQKK